MASLAFHTEWISALHEPPEIRETSAMLKIALGDKVLTRHEDEWSRTIRDDVRLSAYPFALWIASSWWRLRWEPLAISGVPNRSWRMAHEMTAAGHGYIWPRITFASDGESIQISAAPSPVSPRSAIRYLSGTHDVVAGADFERAADDFLSATLARLDAVGVGRTPLHELWTEVLEERRDAALARQRRFEAMVGFDPDESPPELLQRLENLTASIGSAATSEIVPVCASRNPAKSLSQILSFADSPGLKGQIKLSLPSTPISFDTSVPVWQRGRELARRARGELGLNGLPISDAQLCDFVSLPPAQALDVSTADRPLLGVAIRHKENSQLKFLLRKRNIPGRRFELARLIGDYLIAEPDDAWLPITDAKTARQKIQRAFAAEFLCPVDALTGFLDGDFSSDAVDAAAEHFGVAQRSVEVQLVNNHLLPRDVLFDDAGNGDFLYCP